MQLQTQKARESVIPGPSFCAPKGIRTPDLLFRRQTLYPAELWAQFLFSGVSLTPSNLNKLYWRTGTLPNRGVCNIRN